MHIIFILLFILVLSFFTFNDYAMKEKVFYLSKRKEKDTWFV